MGLNFKNFLSLDNIMGKKLVSILYYSVAIAIVVNFIASFFGGIIYLAQGNLMAGLGGVIFSLPLALLYFLIARVVCELVVSLFDLCGKNNEE